MSKSQTADVVANGGEVKKKKRRLWLKITCIVLAVIIGLIAALGVTALCVWDDEITTIKSFRKIRSRNDANKEGAVYYMKVKGGYYFDDFLAQGGASGDKQLLNFITSKITRGLMSDTSVGETNIGCSSFTATTPSGDILFARNYDFDKTNVCLTVCNPKDGRYKSFSSVDLNYIGLDIDSDVQGFMNNVKCLAAPYVPLDGINSAGVSCGIYMSYQGNDDTGTVATDQKDASKPNITSTTMLRLVLDYADSVQKAVELISKHNLHDSAKTSFHYMVADASGKSAILEWLPQDGTDASDNDGSARVLNVIYNDDPMYDSRTAQFKYQWITNFIVKGADSYYATADKRQGGDRYDLIADRLAATNGIVANEQAAMSILAEVGRRTYNGGGGVTVHSAVYNLTKRTVLWVSNENYGDADSTFVYSLNDGLLKSGVL